MLPHGASPELQTLTAWWVTSVSAVSRPSSYSHIIRGLMCQPCMLQSSCLVSFAAGLCMNLPFELVTFFLSKTFWPCWLKCNTTQQWNGCRRRCSNRSALFCYPTDMPAGNWKWQMYWNLGNLRGSTPPPTHTQTHFLSETLAASQSLCILLELDWVELHISLKHPLTV